MPSGKLHIYNRRSTVSLESGEKPIAFSTKSLLFRQTPFRYHTPEFRGALLSKNSLIYCHVTDTSRRTLSTLSKFCDVNFAMTQTWTKITYQNLSLQLWTLTILQITAMGTIVYFLESTGLKILHLFSLHFCAFSEVQQLSSTHSIDFWDDLICFEFDTASFAGSKFH